MTIAGLSPNGTATGYVHRRRLERIAYPESPEAFAEEGFDPAIWCPDAVGFTARIVASINGLEERQEREIREAYLAAPTDDTRRDYYKELAWRVPEWNFSTEGSDGEVVLVPAPGEHGDNWQAFDLLPFWVLTWLAARVRTIHLPKRPKLEAPPTPSTTGTSTPTATSPDPTPPPS